LNSHTDLVAHTHEEESAFSALNGDLTDQLIEALGEELFTGRVNSGLAGLAGLKFLVELILEVHNVDLVSGSRGDVTHPELTVLSVLTGRQDRVQVIFVTGGGSGFLEGGKLLLLLLGSLLVGDAGGDEDGGSVFHEGIERLVGHIMFKL
jgi:hypothetical protein